MSEKLPPDKASRLFFAAMMESNCHITWSLFTRASQNHFAQWALEDLYARNGEAAKRAEIGLKEMKLMFERNDSALMKFFWRRFFYSCAANELYRLGHFATSSIQGKNAVVKVTLKYPNGQVAEIGLPMVHERGGWKLAYAENNLPF